ncbi:hypothetical protein ASA_2063 [Aeromonas salmonicida subsp. salmonicida A449]|uniref:Uncharacterized protein n=1 Tax=Aeromonas salmonicida (strain A449) TaxID=382245 RepID=A4SMK8_AERS4|nr:hypothetical protein ASA_2063 [Aeromonas salmonicida subsp. salmonicida A449]
MPPNPKTPCIQEHDGSRVRGTTHGEHKQNRLFVSTSASLIHAFSRRPNQSALSLRLMHTPTGRLPKYAEDPRPAPAGSCGGNQNDKITRTQ